MLRWQRRLLLCCYMRHVAWKCCFLSCMLTLFQLELTEPDAENTFLMFEQQLAIFQLLEKKQPSSPKNATYPNFARLHSSAKWQEIGICRLQRRTWLSISSTSSIQQLKGIVAHLCTFLLTFSRKCWKWHGFIQKNAPRKESANIREAPGMSTRTISCIESESTLGHVNPDLIRAGEHQGKSQPKYRSEGIRVAN